MKKKFKRQKFEKSKYELNLFKKDSKKQKEIFVYYLKIDIQI